MTKKYDFALLSGGFDPVHIGHLAMIKEASHLADEVIILLNSDKWLARKKGKPFMVETQRVLILQEFKSVSKVIIQKNDDDDSSNNAIIEFYKDHEDRNICYCNGGDRSQESKIRESKICKDLGIDLEFGIGGIHKLESSSSLTKNHLSDIETRPWGNFHIIAKGKGYQIKEININPGKKQSLQRHKHRSEYWQIISGKGMVYLEDSKCILEENDNIFIPKGDLHRMENTEDCILTLIEIQIGNKISEEDIERIEDDFGRI
jgi:cytidyltransferase-like protein|tara:strand:- start:6412 stop:7194 length:783 start_codon:yes stop_codon:yes gene_type:complete